MDQHKEMDATGLQGTLSAYLTDPNGTFLIPDTWQDAMLYLSAHPNGDAYLHRVFQYLCDDTSKATGTALETESVEFLSALIKEAAETYDRN